MTLYGGQEEILLPKLIRYILTYWYLRERRVFIVSKGTVVLRRLGVKRHNDLALSTEFMVSITTIKKLCNLLTMAN